MPSFSNISAMNFRAPALPKKQGLGLLQDLLTPYGFHKVVISQWSQYFHSRATPACGITHLVPCLWQWQWCIFPEKLLSSFQSFSSMYHNACVSIAGQMSFPLSVAILLIQTNRPAGAQHIFFFSQHTGSPLGEELCLARPHCNTHATRVQLQPGLGDQMCSELFHAISMSLESMATGMPQSHPVLNSKKTGRENYTMAGLSLSTHKPLMQQYLPSSNMLYPRV